MTRHFCVRPPTENEMIDEKESSVALISRFRKYIFDLPEPFGLKIFKILHPIYLGHLQMIQKTA